MLNFINNQPLRYWYRKLSCFYKVFKKDSAIYLFTTIHTQNSHYRTRNSHIIPHITVTHNFLNSFFLPALQEWNKLDYEIRDSHNIAIFKSKLLKFIQPYANSVVTNDKPKGIESIIHLHSGFSQLRKQKFRHSLQDSINPFPWCGRSEVE